MRRGDRATARHVLALAIASVSIVIASPARLPAQSAGASPEIHAQLTPAAEPHRERIVAAMQEAGARYREWLGPPPGGSITVTDQPWLRPLTAQRGWVAIDLPWRSSPETMEIESAVAHGIARQWWPGLLSSAVTAPLVNGAAWYLQSLVVERLFDLRFLSTAHSADGVRYFGGAMPWAFRPLTLGRSTAGLGRADFLRGAHADRWPPAGRRLPSSMDADALRGALAFGTLERYLTWPVLQAALHAWAQRAAEGPMSRADIAATIGAAAGQDLSWFFDTAFAGQTGFDYALESFSTGLAAGACEGGPCYRTRATAVRRGDGQFTGAGRPAAGAYESGDAMVLRVWFANGQDVTARWDGRHASRTFEFDSRSPATAVRLDPDRTLLLDENYLDDARVVNAPTNVPVGKWVARWMVWLQDAMLAYGSLF